MSLTEHLRLQPSSLTMFVIPEFYGGPLDGSRERAVSMDDLLGTIRTRGGRYGLVGFRSSYPNDDFLKDLSLDYAVYEWNQ